MHQAIGRSDTRAQRMHLPFPHSSLETWHITSALMTNAIQRSLARAVTP